MNNINFFIEDIDFEMGSEANIKSWLLDIAQSESFTIDTINYILCSDEYLLDINRQYLNHDYYTDIITFDHSDAEQVIISDIFISINRVKENAQEQEIEFSNELHRVFVHGLLHLIGYNDKTAEERNVMRQKEDACLSLLN